MIVYRKQILAMAIILCSLFTFSDYKSKEQIHLLSDKTAELSKSNEKLNSEITDLMITNKELLNEGNDLRERNVELNSKIEELNLNSQKLIESNNKLQNENADLKKKLEAANASNQTATNTGTDKTAYLTFDDGPSDNTIKILDILKENNIKATFFVNGHPESKLIYVRIVNEGHTLANHTYSHDYAAVYKTIEGFNNDKQKLDDFLFAITGIRTQILRFPGGSNNHVSYNYGGVDFMDKLTKYEKQIGIKYFDWNVDSTDASVLTQAKDKIINEVLNGSKNKKQAIILMHDSKPKTTTAQALPDIIKGLKGQGFKFSVLTPKVNGVQFK
ncbi:polysaccharide deacetylase family protein [Candidatus Clostridium radicumherbarum]|uniref:Polysaccharide deacetylase family protein n=1 Tax=Candidatus Clostridium radicumherbarum TaxID=3381662 RepID=A0ABW8TRI9_9CLOT